ncbi:SDR family oxidoreductase [Flavobacteriaceae bacterium TP-CH-4]|uniref:SDR family oxidoreductase n=1 Tax=Pelagihabitans pacificus TaxID=2696054 RepID=A0A967AU46_9FLAO|nr:SDR family oxidoreductase [Pelagihabitans pacificus]NHF59230.1 SDR family oxidoreductase [Pelagihabitans pacificus]
MASITGKTVWITGASSGIGEALAYELGKKGCNIILSARKETDLLRVKSKSPYPEKVEILTLDLMDFKGMPAKTKEAVGLFGPIDILVNNAGVSQRSLIVETDFNVFEKLMDVNYLGTIALTKAILPYFINEKNGHFVTVTSLMGRFGSPFRSGYCAAKHALHGFFDVLRMEHQKDGILVTLICPGFVQTNVAKNALTADGSQQRNNDVATEKGLPVALFATKMIRAIENKKYEAYIGRRELMGIYLKRFFPKLLHKVVLRSTVR